MSEVQIIGYFCEGANYKKVSDDFEVLDFSLYTQTRKGEEKKAQYHDCVAYNKSAQIIQEKIKKGDKIFIKGFIKNDVFENENGEKRKKVKYIVNDFMIFSSEKNEENYEEMQNKNEEENKEKIEELKTKVNEIFLQEKNTEDKNLPF